MAIVRRHDGRGQPGAGQGPGRAGPAEEDPGVAHAGQAADLEVYIYMCTYVRARALSRARVRKR